VGGDPGEVHAAAVVLDHEEDVEAPQQDGVDVGEVNGKDAVGADSYGERNTFSRRCSCWADPRFRASCSGGSG
jgi:hypothetical protein